MELYKIKNNKRNNQQKKIPYRMGKNISKLFIWKGIHNQNL